MAVNPVLQNAGFIISTLSLFMNIIACADRQWRRNDPGREVIETLVRSTGLWERCYFQATGHYQCDDYDSFFIGLPTLLTGARVFTCVAIVIGLFSFLIQIFGLDCIKIAEDQKVQKAKMVICAGFMSVFAGVLMCIGVSWFASEVLQNYYNPMRQQVNMGQGFGNNREQYQLEGNEQYIYGRALFIGWSASLIGIIGGVLSVCSSWGVTNDDDYEAGYAGGGYPNQGYPTKDNRMGNMDREYL